MRVPIAPPLAFTCATLTLFLTLPVHADPAIDALARDVDRTESVRAVKTLQSSYAQYAQYGLWTEAGALFAAEGSFIFDSPIRTKSRRPRRPPRVPPPSPHSCARVTEEASRG